MEENGIPSPGHEPEERNDGSQPITPQLVEMWAERFGLEWTYGSADPNDEGKWIGRNPFEPEVSETEFVLYTNGNAYDRVLKAHYTAEYIAGHVQMTVQFHPDEAPFVMQIPRVEALETMLAYIGLSVVRGEPIGINIHDEHGPLIALQTSAREVVGEGASELLEKPMEEIIRAVAESDRRKREAAMRKKKKSVLILPPGSQN